MPRPAPSSLLAFVLGVAALPAQGKWTPGTPAANPTVVSDHAMVFDVLRACTWLVGGATTGSGLLADTWKYDGLTWTKLAPTTSFSPRLRHAIACDVLRGKVVLFGGSTATNTGHFNDTWEFDGTNWQQVVTASAPSARNDHAMVYDEARQKILLYGGHDAAAVFGDTWEFDGTNWTLLTPLTQPSVRRDFTLVYDRLRQKVVMFGGFAGQGLGVPLNDTWEWNGADWKQVTTPISPSPRGGHVMAYDMLRQRSTLFSGYPITADTWDYDGTKWVQRTTPVAPTGRSGHAMVYDQFRANLVMVGGYDTAFTNDTWLFATTSLAKLTAVGTGCAGTAGTPALGSVGNALPWIGELMTLEVTAVPAVVPLTALLGASDTSWASIPLPIDLGLIGMTNCLLRTSVDLTLPMTNQGGTGTLPLAVPLNLALVGQKLWAQALVLDPGANPGNATLSNSLEILLGAL